MGVNPETSPIVMSPGIYSLMQVRDKDGCRVPPPEAKAQSAMHSFRVRESVSRSLVDPATADMVSLVRKREMPGVNQRYSGGKQKRENQEPADMYANEIPRPARVCRTIRRFPTKRPARHGSLQHKVWV